MKKRTFIKNSSVLLTGSMMSPMISCKNKPPLAQNLQLKNWAGNLTYSMENVQFAKNIEDVIRVVKESRSLRGLGSRHSFNEIADSKTVLLSLRDMKSLKAVNQTSQTITVDAGVRYGDICETIDEKGHALHNLASLPHISIAGACATSTHGSGVTNGSLATGVVSLELVKANGDVVNISQKDDEELFNAAIVGLGSLGIITKVTLDLLPSINMSQVIYRNLPMKALEDHFEEIMSNGYSVSLFTDWRNQNVNQLWIKSKSGEHPSISEPEFYGATLADKNLHPVEGHSAESCTDQMGVEGKWYSRLPHFKMGFTPSSGDELQAEYFVPIDYGLQAMRAVEELNQHISPHLFISEIRTIAEDSFG